MTFRKAVVDSLRWRFWAVIITVAVLLLNNLPLREVGLIALETQLALFVGQAVWIYFNSR